MHLIHGTLRTKNPARECDARQQLRVDSRKVRASSWTPCVPIQHAAPGNSGNDGKPVSLGMMVVLIKHQWVERRDSAHAEVNLVTALVPSDTACLASSPGRMSRTAVWISRLVTVGFLE